MLAVLSLLYCDCCGVLLWYQVTKEMEVTRALDLARAEFGSSPFVAVNCAGIGYAKRTISRYRAVACVRCVGFHGVDLLCVLGSRNGEYHIGEFSYAVRLLCYVIQKGAAVCSGDVQGHAVRFIQVTLAAHVVQKLHVQECSLRGVCFLSVH